MSPTAGKGDKYMSLVTGVAGAFIAFSVIFWVPSHIIAFPVDTAAAELESGIAAIAKYLFGIPVAVRETTRHACGRYAVLMLSENRQSTCPFHFFVVHRLTEHKWTSSPCTAHTLYFSAYRTQTTMDVVACL